MKTPSTAGTLRFVLYAGGLFVACHRPQPANCPTSPAGSAEPAASGAPAEPSEPIPAPTPDVVIIKLTNPSAMTRAKETVALSEVELKKIAPALELAKSLVFDDKGVPVLSQLVPAAAGGPPAELVFQADFAGGEQKTFSVRTGERKLAPNASYQVYARFVRERHDDFAWENDLVAHRMYGPDLETTKKEPLVSSGIDVWSKKVPRLLVNEWYMTDDYHADHGDGADFYAVKTSRGCGGIGIWANEKLAVSKNFVTSRVVANGPIRLIFELDYAGWQAGGGKIAETKRVTLDAGSMFNHFESTFTPKRKDLTVAIGIAKHPGAAMTTDPVTASMRVWEPVDGGKSGNLGCAVVLTPGNGGVEKQTDDNYLFVTPTKQGEPLHYYVGSAWDHAAHVATADAWGEAVRQLSVRLAAPVQLALSAGPGAAPAAPAAPTPAPAAAPSVAAAPAATPAPAPAAPAPAPAAPAPPPAAAKPGAPTLAPPAPSPAAPAPAAAKPAAPSLAPPK